MKILDWYILKRYLLTFFLMLLLFIPIGITVNLAEKIDKMLANEVPFGEIVLFYVDFTIYFANLLFPLFLFLSVMFHLQSRSVLIQINDSDYSISSTSTTNVQNQGFLVSQHDNKSFKAWSTLLLYFSRAATTFAGSNSIATKVATFSSST